MRTQTASIKDVWQAGSSLERSPIIAFFPLLIHASPNEWAAVRKKDHGGTFEN